MCKRIHRVGCLALAALAVLSIGCARATRVVLIPKDVIRKEARPINPIKVQPTSPVAQAISAVVAPLTEGMAAIVAGAAFLTACVDGTVACVTVWRTNAIEIRGDGTLSITIQDGNTTVLVNGLPTAAK